MSVDHHETMNAPDGLSKLSICTVCSIVNLKLKRSTHTYIYIYVTCHIMPHKIMQKIRLLNALCLIRPHLPHIQERDGCRWSGALLGNTFHHGLCHRYLAYNGNDLMHLHLNIMYTHVCIHMYTSWCVTKAWTHTRMV